MEISNAFGKVLRELRLKAGLTQEQLALEADIRRTFVSVLELGQQQPSITSVYKLSKALNISMSRIMELVELEISKK